MIKGSIQEDRTILNMYVPNIVAPQYVRQMVTNRKVEIDSNTIIVGDFNTPLSSMDRSSRQKNNKEIEALNNTLDELNLIPKAADYTVISSAHGTSPGLTTC